MPVTMLSGGRIEYHGALAYGLTVHPVGTYDARRKLELMLRFRPQALLANTSYIGRLGSLLGSLPERPGLDCLIAGGEGSGFAWLERLQETWGVPVYDRYGTTQMGNDHMFTCDRGIGTAARPGMLHNIDPLVLAEVVDPATGRHVADGEEGEIVVTSLFRLDTPIIRCRTADRAVYRDARSCGCGRPFDGVEIASISRMDDMKKVKGVNVWPQAVDDVLFGVPEVEEYRVELTSGGDGADVANLHAVPRHPLAADAASRLRERIGEELVRRIGIHFEVELLAPGGLPADEWKARRWTDRRQHVRTAGRS
jgi:phenylacetate-CoA ligase